MKRFYKNASVAEFGDNFVVQLDGRSIKTKSKRTLEVPSAALAEIIAEEWNLQGEDVDPAAMPMMTLTNTTLDRVMPFYGEVADMLAAYGANDLLCYRAKPSQFDLLRKQKDQWNPWLDWAMRELDAPLRITTGIMPVEQDEKSVSVLASLVHATTAFELTALHEFTTISGSLVLGLAVLREQLTATEALRLGLLDELHQAALWGEDFEARARREKYHYEITKAEIFLKALRTCDR